MFTAERHTNHVAFFGRLADDLTRRVLRPEEVSVSLEGHPRPVLRKEDGHFAVVDVEPSATDYRIRIDGPAYQTRMVAKARPTPAPVQVAFAGEDELYLALMSAPTLQNRVSFAPVAFVPPIEAGASVIGEGGFTTKLAEPLEGRDVGFAVLTASAGLAAGQLLRIVRSPSLLVRPGPSYAFPDRVTVVVVHVVENDPTEAPIGDATVTITGIDGAAPTVIPVGDLSLSRFSLAGTPPGVVILDAEDQRASSNRRGDAIFYFSESVALTSVQFEVSKAQHQTAPAGVSVTARARNFTKVSLTRL